MKLLSTNTTYHKNVILYRLRKLSHRNNEMRNTTIDQLILVLILIFPHQIYINHHLRMELNVPIAHYCSAKIKEYFHLLSHILYMSTNTLCKIIKQIFC